MGAWLGQVQLAGRRKTLGAGLNCCVRTGPNGGQVQVCYNDACESVWISPEGNYPGVPPCDAATGRPPGCMPQSRGPLGVPIHVSPFPNLPFPQPLPFPPAPFSVPTQNPKVSPMPQAPPVPSAVPITSPPALPPGAPPQVIQPLPVENPDFGTTGALPPPAGYTVASQPTGAWPGDPFAPIPAALPLAPAPPSYGPSPTGLDASALPPCPPIGQPVPIRRWAFGCAFAKL